MATEKERFLKISVEQWKYELESGEVAWDEHSVREWLWFKANPVTGKVVVNYKVLAMELRKRFPDVKRLENKLSKIMASLKRKKMVWFDERVGERGAFGVELQGYPLISRKYVDISYRFQAEVEQRFGKIETKKLSCGAEVLEVGQRSGMENVRENGPLSASQAEVLRESKKIKEERERTESPSFDSSSLPPEKDELGKEDPEDETNKESNKVEYWGPDEVWEYFRSSILKRKGIEPPPLTETATSRIEGFLERYGPEKATELIDYYLDSDNCKKDREKMGLTLSIIFGEIVINRWINSLGE